MQNHRQLPSDALPTISSHDNYKQIRPEWAKFSMEKIYWDALDAICSHGHLKAYDFVRDARLERPALTVASAVRLRIARYFLDRAETSFCPLSIDRQELGLTAGT